MAPRTPKVTRLEDNAEIYRQRETKTEREKLSELDFHGKVEYFKNYYLMKVVITLLIVGLLTWILVTMLRPKKETVLSVALVNFPLAGEDIEQMTADMSETLNVDPETQKITFDTGYDLVNEDIASYEKLTTYIYAGEIDVFIAPESQFLKYAFSETLLPISEVLSPELINDLTKDQLFSSKIRGTEDESYPEEATGPEDYYGIYIQDLPMFEYFTEDSITDDPPVLGVIANTKHQANTEEFIRYLLEQLKTE